MIVFRALLIAGWTALLAYTVTVIARHGLDFLPVFLGDIAAMTWPGQFNADFLCFLTLAAIWTAWRNDFNAGGLCLAALAFVGGAGFMLPYLLILSARASLGMPEVLMGAPRLRRWVSSQRPSEG